MIGSGNTAHFGTTTRRWATVLTVTATAGLSLAFVANAYAASTSPTPNGPAQVSLEAHRDISPPLRQLAPAPTRSHHVYPAKALPHRPQGVGTARPLPRPSVAAPNMPATVSNFLGMGKGFSGPAGSFTFSGTPPDPNGSVGPNHFVEVVNTAFAVFNKTGTALYGPVPTNTLWSGFGGGCETNNDGDGTVRYDRIADRWLISQVSVNTTPYLECVAVSTSPDPTGTYARYAFDYGSSNFPDYPKISVWPDGYYATFNM